MASDDLAQIAIGIATVAAVLIPLSLAAAGLVFQLVVGKAGDIGRSALSITTSSANAIAGLGTDEYEALWNDSYSEEEFTTLLKLISSTDFHPMRFHADRFRTDFRTAVDAFVEHARSVSSDRNAKAKAMHADFQDFAKAREGLEFARLTQRLNRVWFPIQGALEAFGRDVELYSDVLATWARLRRDIRNWSIPAVLIIIVSITVAICSLTVSPRLFTSNTVNLIVALLLLIAVSVGLARLAMSVREISTRS